MKPASYDFKRRRRCSACQIKTASPLFNALLSIATGTTIRTWCLSADQNPYQQVHVQHAVASTGELARFSGGHFPSPSRHHIRTGEINSSCRQTGQRSNCARNGLIQSRYGRVQNRQDSNMVQFQAHHICVPLDNLFMCTPYSVILSKIYVWKSI